MRRIDITGHRFGKLVAISPLSITDRDRKRVYWLCQCDCGTSKLINTDSLRRGLSESCGCDQFRKIAEARKTHGHSPKSGWSRTYKTWTKMIERCRNKKDSHHYKYYIERGITVCKRWMSFENFIADMGERPPEKSIDRINVDGNYETNNCRWATSKEQAMNRRKKEKING
jgi:hypothetical protein